MRSALIGHTGFVGSNLAAQHTFSECYNSKNIASIEGQEFDLIVCSGVQAKKWWANQNPAEDWAGIEALVKRLDKVKAQRFVVISSVDVYPKPAGVDENFDCHAAENHAYGKNRLKFEDEMKARFKDVFILRLSGLFGEGLKKNIIYDLLHDNCLEMINPNSAFQWYSLDNIWADVGAVIEKDIRLVNLVNEPVKSAAIIDLFAGKQVGQKPSPEAHYDLRTIHAQKLGGKNGYIKPAATVLKEIAQFVTREKAKLAQCA